MSSREEIRLPIPQNADAKISAPQMDLTRAFAHAHRHVVEAEMAAHVAIDTAKDAAKLHSRHVTWGIHAYEAAASQRHHAGLAAVYTLIGLLSPKNVQ